MGAHIAPRGARLGRVARFAFSTLLAAVALRAAGPAPASASADTLFLYDQAALTRARARLAHGDTDLDRAVSRLRRDADRAVAARLQTVVDKSRVPPSGDKHDYLSQAPYWWPDPTKANGLPYIRHDGRRNPEVDQSTDHDAWYQTAGAIITLADAYFFTGEEKYALAAARRARIWFVDPATRMNPNLNFAQYVPGRNDGRGEGLIEMHLLPQVGEALTLIAPSGAWSDDDRAAFHTWLSRYADWLATSKNGREESNAKNNHGSWCDVQTAYLALALGRTDQAKALLQSDLQRRIARQIEADGRQPLELARTKSLNYCLFNLEALFELGELGRNVGIDYWRFETADHRSLDAALRYLAPYADPTKDWIKADLIAADRDRILALIAERLCHGGDPELERILRRFDRGDAPWHLHFVRD